MTAAAAKLVRWVRGPKPKQLTCQQAATAMGRGELTIVDVREHHERAQSRIVGSLHIPLGDMASHLNELSQAVPVAFICRAGNRSEVAAKWALEHGPLAANVVGGLLAWEHAGLALRATTVTPRGGQAHAA